MNQISSKPLKTGDTIGLVTPSSPLMPGRLEAGILYFENKGFKVKVGRHNTKSNRFLAGIDQERAADLMDFFKDPEVKAIIATGGGYGSQRILPHLDYDVIRHNPKILIGASDTTALQLGLFSKVGLLSYTGFTCGDVHDQILSSTIEHTLMAGLYGKHYTINEGESVVAGIAEGFSVGGNLECMIALMGTPYQPSFEHNILFIEEVRQEPYKVDCMLSQLSLAGVFEQVSGVIFCQFEKCTANYFPDRDGTVEDVIEEWSSRLKVPCIKNFPYGHGEHHQYVLPIGAQMTLNANKGSIHVRW